MSAWVISRHFGTHPCRGQDSSADGAGAFLDALSHLGLAEKTGTLQIDKSVLGFPDPRRIRDRDHIRHVISQSCLICRRQPSDPHHLRLAQSRALGRKVSDEFTVPLCRGHHREVHRSGNEVAWWGKAGINPTVTARALWLETHPLPRAVPIAGNNESAANANDAPRPS